MDLCLLRICIFENRIIFVTPYFRGFKSILINNICFNVSVFDKFDLLYLNIFVTEKIPHYRSEKHEYFRNIEWQHKCKPYRKL